MNYFDCKEAVKLTILAGRVPVIVGERGIGKTAMMKSISSEMGMNLVNIDMNLLKEGEITGRCLPTYTVMYI